MFFLNEYLIEIRPEEGVVIFRNEEYWPYYREFRLWIEDKDIITVFKNQGNYFSDVSNKKKSLEEQDLYGVED